MTVSLITDIFSSQKAKPIVIAEMSGNHNQSLDRALSMVEAAANAGVHAIKLQTYTADTMTLDIDSSDFYINDADSIWNGNSLYSLYNKAHTPWDWHESIFSRAKELGLIAFSSPFDSSSVDFLETLDVPCYKISSFENTDIPLIKKVASTGKPVIISTGMATVAELNDSVQAARHAGCENLLLLKCTSTYPASPENSNLHTIQHMRELFNCEVGLSDHTLGIGAAVASIALGARVIEKHFTLDRNDGAVDSSFSLNPNELAQLVTEVEHAWLALGNVRYGPSKEEKSSIKRRRSIYSTQDMRAGEILTEHNIRCIRPGYGLAPKHYDSLIGRVIKIDVKKGTPIQWDILK